MTDNICTITGKNEDIEWLMNGIERRLKITRNGIITKHLGVEYEWRKTKYGRNFCKAVMNKKIEATINHYEKYIGKEVKIYRTPGIPHENLDKNDGDPIDIDQYRSLVGQIIFFSTKVGVKTGAAIRSLSSFMSDLGPKHWKAMELLFGNLKGINLKDVIFLEPDTFQKN